MSEITIRFAREADCEEIFQLICELAQFEKALDQVKTSPEELRKNGFGNKPLFECLVAEREETVVGFTLFFTTYSTWKGPCLYLEDFAVLERLRSKGIGTKLFNALLKLAEKRNVKRFAWQVLDWNKEAIKFYKNYKAELDDEWINCRIHFD